MKTHIFVICAYKESPYLEECIDSLKKQTRETDIAVVTSTPNEYIKNLAEKYELPIYVNPGEGGIGNDFGYALQIGAKEHRFITIAHQDDTYEPKYAERIIQAMEKARKPIIGFTDYYELRGNEKVTSNRNLKIKQGMLFPLRSSWMQKNRFVRRCILGLGNPICCPSVTFYGKKVEHHRIFQSNFKSNVDWYAWEFLSRMKGSFVYVPQQLMMHRVHEGSTTTKIIEENTRTQEDFAMFRLFWPSGIAKFLTKIYAKSEESNQIQ